MPSKKLSIILSTLCVAMLRSTAAAECTRLPDGSWQCQPSEPAATPTAMDIRIECPTARGSGTSVARLPDGGTLVVTNHHVIRDQPNIVLHSGDGRTAAGELLAVDAANDLAAIAVRERWPIVILGDDVTIGMPVQFRAFDRGVTFRKYFGAVATEYQQPGGAGGYFATGRSVPGNSGGGVYRHGRLVGVVWGNPDGGTAFVRIGPVRELIDRVIRQSPLPQRTERVPIPRATPTPEHSAPTCDCEQRFRQLEQQLSLLAKRQPADGSPDKKPPAIPFDWLPLVAAAVGASSPIGIAIVVASVLWRKRTSRHANPDRGQGGPRSDGFRSPTH